MDCVKIIWRWYGSCAISDMFIVFGVRSLKDKKFSFAIENTYVVWYNILNKMIIIIVQKGERLWN